MAALIDEEVKALIDGAYEGCVEILTAKRKELERTAAYLLEYENMDSETFELVFTSDEPLPPPDGETLARRARTDAGPDLLPQVAAEKKPSKTDLPSGELPH